MGIDDLRIPCLAKPSIWLPDREHLGKFLDDTFYLHIIKMSTIWVIENMNAAFLLCICSWVILRVVWKHHYVLAAHFDFTSFFYFVIIIILYFLWFIWFHVLGVIFYIFEVYFTINWRTKPGNYDLEAENTFTPLSNI